MRPRSFLPAVLLAMALLWHAPVHAATQPGVSVERLKAIMGQLSKRHGRKAALRIRQRVTASVSTTQSVPKTASKPPSVRVPQREQAVSSSSVPRLPAIVVPDVPTMDVPVLPRRPARPAPPQVSVSAQVRDMRDAILRLVNGERAKAGLGSLSGNAFLDASAQLYALDMAANDFFSHTGLDGSSSTDRIRATGYLTAPCDCDWTFWTGENLGKMQKTAEDVMRDWMNSPGHRANIVNPSYTEIGIGYADGYWVQHFGKVRED